MPVKSEKFLLLKKSIGKIFSEIRKGNNKISLTQLSYQYDIDKGNLSRIERGISDCRISTAWRIAEAAGIKFSDFAKMLEDELGKDFTFIDE
jgi:transcriptional regulator with XRE-family HTH domain